jgi:D-alanyl-D-alanine carboxypeptidase
MASLNDRFPEVRPGLIDVSASNLSVKWTAGGLVSTASDLVAFGRALRDGRLIGAAEANRMAPFFEVPAKSGETGKPAVSLGLFRHVIEGVGPVLGHGGAVLGSTASLWWSSHPDLVLAVVCNVGTTHAGPGLASAGTVAVDSDLVQATLALVRGEATG